MSAQASAAEPGISTRISGSFLSWVERNVSGGGWWGLGARGPGQSPHCSALSLAASAVSGLHTSGSSCVQLPGGAQAAVRAGCLSAGDLRPGPQTPPPKREERPRRKKRTGRGAGGWGLRGEDCLFVLKNLLAFPNKSENPAGGSHFFPPGPPTSESGKPETHICFCF